MYMLMTTITEYVTAFGMTATIGGMVSGIYVFGGLFSRICSGRMMGRYGWKMVALSFLALHFVACLFYFVSDSIGMLLVVRFIHGLGFGASSNAIMVIGMSSLPMSRYGEATGYFMLSTSLGIAIGPFVGGLVYDTFGGTGSFTGAAILSLAAFLFMCFADTSSIDPLHKKKVAGGKTAGGKTSAGKTAADKPAFARRGEREPAKGLNRFFEKRTVPVAVCILFLSVGYASLLSFYRLYAAELGMTKEFSGFFLIYALIILVSRPAAGMIQDRFGDGAVCYPCMACQVAALVLIAWHPCMLTVVACAVGSALGYGTLNSTLNVIANRNVSNERRSYAVATYWAFCDLGVGVSPTFLGAIVTAAGFHAMYYTAAVIVAAAIPVYWYTSMRRKNWR